MAFAQRVFNLFRRTRLQREIEAELAAHLDLRTGQNIAQGMTEKQARREALLRFGNPALISERAAAEDAALPFADAWRDLRYGIRQLMRHPGFAWTAVLVLALGIGASAALFAFADAALLRPLPYANPAQLMDVTESAAMFPRANLSYPNYQDWKQRNTSFQSLDAYRGQGLLFTNGHNTQPVRGADVTANFFRTLGVEPALGSNFLPDADQPQAPKTVLLSYGAWQQYFAGRASIIGQPILLNSEPVTVIGVLPRTFQFAPRGDAGFWLPIQVHPNGPNCYIQRASHCLFAVGRLKSGVTLDQARSEMDSIAARLRAEYPESNRGQGASVQPLSELIVGSIRPLLLTLLAGAGLLLVIACVNVSSLLLVRTEIRRRETALRTALGASRSRLLRQFFTEACLLVTLGGTLGLAAAELAMHCLLLLLSKDMLSRMPYLQGLGLNPHIILFTGTVSLLAIALFSVVPLVRIPRRQAMQSGLAEAGSGTSGTFWRRFGSSLVALELAIAIVLLVGAGLLGRSMYRLLHVELGFNPNHLATLEIGLPDKQYATEAKQRDAAQEIQRRLSSLPGVSGTGTTDDLAVSGNGDTYWVRFVGRPYNGEHNEVLQRQISAEYLQTLGATLSRGRYFTPAEDNTKPKVVLINQAFATKYFPGQDPIGKQFADYKMTPDTVQTIIGVIADVREGGLDEELWPAIYQPFNQNPDTYMQLLVRTHGDAGALLPSMVEAVHRFDPGIATANPATLEDRIADSPAAYLHRSAAWLATGFAALALLLSIIGLYGVISYSVSRRTREIGVRMALGAERHTVARLVLRDAGRMIAAGLVCGLVCSIGAAWLMRSLLFGTVPWDAPTLSIVGALLYAASMAASYLPARRAASVNPADALRAE